VLSSWEEKLAPLVLVSKYWHHLLGCMPSNSHHQSHYVANHQPFKGELKRFVMKCTKVLESRYYQKDRKLRLEKTIPQFQVELSPQNLYVEVWTYLEIWLIQMQLIMPSILIKKGNLNADMQIGAVSCEYQSRLEYLQTNAKECQKTLTNWGEAWNRFFLTVHRRN
jgi:hypothetical protein